MSANEVTLLEQLQQPQNEVILHFISIEEDIQKLEVMLEDESLQKKDEIFTLLNEISSLSISTRKKTIELLMANVDDIHSYETKNIVTAKEIKELLEDFA